MPEGRIISPQTRSGGLRAAGAASVLFRETCPRDEPVVVEKHQVCAESTDRNLPVSETPTAQFIGSVCFSRSQAGLFQWGSFGVVVASK